MTQLTEQELTRWLAEEVMGKKVCTEYDAEMCLFNSVCMVEPNVFKARVCCCAKNERKHGSSFNPTTDRNDLDVVLRVVKDDAWVGELRGIIKSDLTADLIKASPLTICRAIYAAVEEG